MIPGPHVTAIKTSEVMRRAASLLELIADKTPDSDIAATAAELRVRALWIERARHDPGLSTERQLGVAIVEDVEGRP